VEESKAELKGFCAEVVFRDKEKRKLSRKMDWQRRANNPNYYQSNGVVKKGKKKWANSNRYIKTRSAYRELERKIKETRKQLHGRDTNQILHPNRKTPLSSISENIWQKCCQKSTKYVFKNDKT
jgi:hypothetical protein